MGGSYNQHALATAIEELPVGAVIGRARGSFESRNQVENH